MLKKAPYLVYSDCRGKIYVHPSLRIVGMEGERVRLPRSEELIPLPEGSTFYYLPQRYAIGYNRRTDSFEQVETLKNKKIYAVGCFLPPTYLRLLLPAYWLKKDQVSTLPLWAYNTIGYYAGKYWTTALRIDQKTRQFPYQYDAQKLEKNVRDIARQFPKNRLVSHLSYCALHYHCLAAKNFFLGRWEAPLPASRSCNSGCFGCLSLQDEEGIASHRRIGFIPSAEELAQVALFHIQRAKEPIVSFGQGCEGEPLLVHKVIRETIKRIRDKTARGTININTNASKPEYLRKIIDAGLDSMRVSLSSAQELYYDKYFRPRGYGFKDVIESIKIAKQNSVFVSINLLTFPGFSDDKKESDALLGFIKKTKIDMLQLKNLNIDPQVFFRHGFLAHTRPIGMMNMFNLIRRSFPRLKISYFNVPREEFSHTD